MPARDIGASGWNGLGSGTLARFIASRWKQRAKRILFETGILGALHRVRNRNVLAVAAFHRVLAPGDPRNRAAHRRWTVSDADFARCLRFFAGSHR